MSVQAKELCPAVVTIRGASEMTKAQRKKIAQWLRDTGDFLEQEGERFAGRFTGRFHAFKK